MKNVQSFSPIIHPTSHTLILGSMPGKKSLTDVQYYAHPRNAFWHIMGELFGAGLHLSYDKRIETLLANNIALWDVIGRCTRSTSLDSDIVEQSIVPNDFHHLLTTYPDIKRILFNGAKAEASFKKYVRPTIPELVADIATHRLTSTSPANARYSISDKITLWRTQLLPAER